MFERSKPYNDLPALPPAGEVETSAVLKKAITASRSLAELKGMAERMPNQAMLIDSLVLQEVRASSKIENILTTNDEVYKAASDEAQPASPEAKEVLRYRQALNHGFRQIKTRPLATGMFVEIAQHIKASQFDTRRVPGTRIANSKGETIYTPPEGEVVIRDKLRDLENFMHADGSLVIAWAGWNHLQQATAIAGYYLDVKDNEGWPPERLQPLLAGLLELVPWLEQWHNDLDPVYGERMGDYYKGFVAEEAQALGFTLDDLRAWKPSAAAAKRGRRKVAT